MNVSSGAKQQVIPANYLGDTLSSIINHHGQVVSRHTIVAQEHHVVDHRLSRTSDNIFDDVLLVICSKPPCWWTTAAFTFRSTTR